MALSKGVPPASSRLARLASARSAAVLMVAAGGCALFVIGTTAGWAVAAIVGAALAAGAVASRIHTHIGLRNRFDAASYLTDEAIVVLDEDYSYSYVSPSIASLLGYQPVDFASVPIKDLVHPSDFGGLAAASRELRRGQIESFERTVRLRHRRSRWRWIEIATANRLDDPMVKGVVSTLRDVSARVEAEQALRSSSDRFHALVANSADVLVLLDVHGRAIDASATLSTTLGLELGALVGVDLATIVHPDDAEAASAVFDEIRETPAATAQFEIRVRRGDGRFIWVEVRLQNLLEDPAVGGVVLHAIDISARVEARRAAARFRSIIENTSDMVVVTDGDGVPEYLNDPARRVLGVAPDDDVGEIEPYGYFTRPSWKRITEEGLAVSRAEGVWSAELELVNPDDESVTPVSHVLITSVDDGGELEYLASISRDMSNQKELEEQLKHQADHDELTGLPNRQPLVDYLKSALVGVQRFGGGAGVLFIDVDRFKVINDSLGHRAGDDLLMAVADRLVGALRPQDLAGRFGGDEFVVICPGLGDAAELAEHAEAVREALRGRLALSGDDVFVTASIGAVVGFGEQSSAELLRDADAAMYQAKAHGRDRVQLFDGTMRHRVVERLQIERELRRALIADELIVYYQPVVWLPGGRIAGAEALVRWAHPERGLLPPAEFLPVAEETGLVVDIGELVLRRACADACSWPAGGPSRNQIDVYVNLSARELADPGLVPRISGVLDSSGVAPDRVHFEITENALLADAIATKAVLLELRRAGVRLALDDFGTGFSSLAYLKHFPVDTLKIDKTFVEGLGTDRGDEAITAAIVDVAQRLELHTIAEGVEQQHQADWLIGLGCDLAQGFHYHKPLTSTELVDVVRAQDDAVIDVRDRAQVDPTARP